MVMGKIIRLLLIALVAWLLVGLLHRAGVDVFGEIGALIAFLPGWVRGVLTGLVIVIVIRYLFSGNSNWEEAEDLIENTGNKSELEQWIGYGKALKEENAKLAEDKTLLIGALDEIESEFDELEEENAKLEERLKKLEDKDSFET